MKKTLLIAFVIVGVLGLAYLLTLDTSSTRPSEPHEIEPANVEVVQTRPVENLLPPNPAFSSDDVEEEIPISEAQIESYLERHRRGPENLLAAYQTSQNKKYIEEAAQRFPGDSQVQLAVLLENIFPDNRREWIDAFKTSSPDNPIADYLSALEHFKQNDTLGALRDLSATTEKRGFNSFALEAFQNREELLLFSGLSQLEAKSGAFSHNSLQLESHLKTLTAKIIEWQKTLREAGDSNTAESIIRSGVLMSRHLSDGNGSGFTISQLVGIGTETAILKQLDPDLHYDFLGQTAGERLAELQEERMLRREMASNIALLQSRLTEDETIIYIDRIKLYGELNAYKWLRDKFGDQ